MRARYLLDTTVVSEPLRPRPSPALVSRLRKSEGECVISAPVWHELVYGSRLLPPGSGKRKTLERYLREVVGPAFAVLPYDAVAADWHARERARLAGLGRTPPFIDGQIAAIARVNDLVLVTANAADYGAFEGIRVEDWRSS